MIKRRYPVTIRFNERELADLREMCRFFKVDEKQLLKFCFYQMIQGLQHAQQKMKEDENDNLKIDDSVSDSFSSNTVYGGTKNTQLSEAQPSIDQPTATVDSANATQP